MPGNVMALYHAAFSAADLPITMSQIQFSLLPEACRPLLNKFYREHRSPMRGTNKGQVWVAKQQTTIAALCLTPVNEGHWLTGLFVAPQWRGQGIARRLIDAASHGLDGPLWLFCHPDLRGFYEPQGFTTAQRLPPVLGERFMRYSRDKALVALSREKD